MRDLTRRGFLGISTGLVGLIGTGCNPIEEVEPVILETEKPKVINLTNDFDNCRDVKLYDFGDVAYTLMHIRNITRGSSVKLYIKSPFQHIYPQLPFGYSSFSLQRQGAFVLRKLIEDYGDDDLPVYFEGVKNWNAGMWGWYMRWRIGKYEDSGVAASSLKGNVDCGHFLWNYFSGAKFMGCGGENGRLNKLAMAEAKKHRGVRLLLDRRFIEINEKRENAVLDFIVKDYPLEKGDHQKIVLLYEGLHDFVNNVSRWNSNTKNKDKRMNLMVLTPKLFPVVSKRYLPDTDNVGHKSWNLD